MPKLTGFPRVNIPGPRPLPLVAHMPRVLQFLQDPIPTLSNLRRYGDVAAIVEGCPALVCVFGPERNREVLSRPAELRNDEEFINGPEGSALARIKTVLVAINGEEHKRHRRLMMPAFSRNVLDGYAPMIVDLAERLIERWPIGITVDLNVLLTDLAMAVAVRTLFGLDMHEGMSELGETGATFVSVLSSPLAILAPFDIPGLPYHKGLKLAERMVQLLENVIAEKRRKDKADHDALAMLLHAVDEEGSRLSDDELIAETSTLFVAGHETTAKTLVWTMFLLERHPDILADVLDEVRGVLGGRSMTVADIPRMPLLNRVIQESMRVLSPVPILFLRVAASDVQIGPHTLPVGANVVVSPFATHRDPDLYPEPRRFLPSRWEKLTPSVYEYLPFGAGPRICLGALFAHQALRLILPTILQRTRVKVARNAKISRLTRANILMPRFGIPARLDRPHKRRVEPEPVRGDIHDLLELR